MSESQRPRAVLALVASTVLGVGFFLLPIPVDGRWTVPFDAAVRAVLRGFPAATGVLAMGLVSLGAAGSLLAHRLEGLAPLRSGPLLVGLRLVALPLALALWLRVGPDVLLAPGVGDLVWGKLAVSIAVIIPVGAVALQILTGYGLLELVGGLMQPIMRPVFRVPGRAALDGLMSFIGSYSIGLYLTRTQLLAGHYTRREAFVVVTGFSTVSIGFVGVVAATLDLLPWFAWLVVTWFVASYALVPLLARTWPTTAIDDAPLVAAPDPDDDPRRGVIERALHRAARGEPLPTLVRRGFVDGLLLASSLLGTVLVVGTAAVLIGEHTPLFDVLGAPVAPVLRAMGVPDADRVAPAVLAGITEVYVPALLVRDAALPARFFVAALSVSQLIFFSSVAPMMIDMFREIPVRAHHLVGLFVLRTAVLVPVLWAVVRLLVALGVLPAA